MPSPALTARRRGQRRRFSTSAVISGHQHHHQHQYESAGNDGIAPSTAPATISMARSESMMPMVSTPNTLAFPQYFSDDEYASQHPTGLFSDETEGVMDLNTESDGTFPRTLSHRRRFATGSHDLTLWPRSPTAEELRKTYASLPSSPVVRESPSPFGPPLPPSEPVYVKKEEEEEHPPSFPEPEQDSFSLWDYLREELLATDFDSHQELKWERVSNFLGVPLALERVCHCVIFRG